MDNSKRLKPPRADSRTSGQVSEKRPGRGTKPGRLWRAVRVDPRECGLIGVVTSLFEPVDGLSPKLGQSGQFRLRKIGRRRARIRRLARSLRPYSTAATLPFALGF